MASPVMHAPGEFTRFREAFGRIRAEFEVPAAFPEPDREPPAWALAALDELVSTMQEATHRDAGVERAVVELAPAARS